MVVLGRRRGIDACLKSDTRMLRRIPDEFGSEIRENRRVIVIYDDAVAREWAVHFCGELAEQSQNEAKLQIEWWPFVILTGSTQGAELTEKAADADYLVFASACEGDLPREVKIWIEGWLARRGDREGTLVGLIEQQTPFEIATLKEIYLRHVAHRAGLDYLSHVPPRKSKALPNSIDSYYQRARQMTSVLDEILRSSPSSTPPPTLR